MQAAVPFRSLGPSIVDPPTFPQGSYLTELSKPFFVSESALSRVLLAFKRSPCLPCLEPKDDDGGDYDFFVPFWSVLNLRKGPTWTVDLVCLSIGQNTRVVFLQSSLESVTREVEPISTGSSPDGLQSSHSFRQIVRRTAAGRTLSARYVASFVWNLVLDDAGYCAVRWVTWLAASRHCAEVTSA